MPKPLLRPKQQQQTQTESASRLSLTPQQNQKQKQQQAQISKMKLDRILRKPRSKAYMEAIHKLDAGGHAQNRAMTEAIIRTIKSELPEIELGGNLLGFCSRCYLGAPYEVHSLDVSGEIIEHFQAGHPMPNGMEKARSIAIRGGYDFIEVYDDCLRAISPDGSVAVIVV